MSYYCVVLYCIVCATYPSILPTYHTYHSILCITTMWHLPLNPLHHHHVTLNTQSFVYNLVTLITQSSVYHHVALTSQFSSLPPCDTYHSVLCLTTMWQLPLSPLLYHHVTRTTHSCVLPRSHTYHSTLCFTSKIAIRPVEIRTVG